MMRHYVPDWTDWGISRDRYRELQWFCRQYPQKKAEAASLLTVSGAGLDPMPHGSDPGDPTFRAVARREQLKRDIDMIESCARMVDGGRWYAALIQNVCLGKPYAAIDTTILPTSKRPTFFQQRRAFFVLLNEARG